MNLSLKRAVRRAVLLVLSTVLTLLCFEAAIRIGVPSHRWKLRDATEDWRLDAELGWANLPGLKVRYTTVDGGVSVFETNDDGLITSAARVRRSDRVLRVMLFGDSVVVGRAVARQDALDAQLEAQLSQIGVEAEVINAGVQGYSTDQVLLAMRKWLPVYKPDLVLYGLCTNDFGGNVSGKAYGLNKPRFVVDSGGGLAAVPFHTSTGIQALGSRSFRTWVQRSALYRLLQPAILKIRSRSMTWEQKSQMGMGDNYYANPADLERVDWGLFAALIRQMRSDAAAHGATFVFYSHPSLEEVWDPYIERVNGPLEQRSYDRFVVENRLKDIAAREGVAFCPLIEPFLHVRDRGPFHLLPRDPHCNSEGYKRTAEVLTSFLAEKGLVPHRANR